MNIIGRKKEQQLLLDCLQSNRPEFLVVYGRRRVGKTYLIREYFNHRFTFYATGVADGKMRDQLRSFNGSLKRYGSTDKTIPGDWFTAFDRLRDLLEGPAAYRDPVSGKRVVFLDELPWMDTARSDFRSALDYFWNSWGSSQSDLLLIVCGSATSWIIEHILGDHGGFYNRVSRQMYLSPFTLQECELFLQSGGFTMPRRQIIECYMIFGGIPYYLNCLDHRLSLAQNIDELCFRETGQLHYEHDRLLRSLFRRPDKHATIVAALAGSHSGMTRVELAEHPDIGNGQPLTKALLELEQCGFLRRYRDYTLPKQGQLYQLIDPFILFSMRFLTEQAFDSWMTFLNSPGYYAWSGNAFEIVCLNHIPQMKRALNVLGVESHSYAWRSKRSHPGAQIDLLIDRRDDVINLCEMKFTRDVYTIDAAYEKQLLHKVETFRSETETHKALHLTMVSASGLAQNSHSDVVQNIITGDDLFT